ncbi:GNAT family N-acetyltransferase, partial [Actinosynnema sp. NPDC023658]
MRIELEWPEVVDERLRAEVHEVLHAVVAAGGAIGWLAPPSRAETDAWLDGVFASPEDGALVVARVDGVLRGTATWR